jgi:hypothetical protein
VYVHLSSPLCRFRLPTCFFFFVFLPFAVTVPLSRDASNVCFCFFYLSCRIICCQRSSPLFSRMCTVSQVLFHTVYNSSVEEVKEALDGIPIEDTTKATMSQEVCCLRCVFSRLKSGIMFPDFTFRRGSPYFTSLQLAATLAFCSSCTTDCTRA